MAGAPASDVIDTCLPSGATRLGDDGCRKRQLNEPVRVKRLAGPELQFD